MKTSTKRESNWFRMVKVKKSGKQPVKVNLPMTLKTVEINGKKLVIEVYTNK